MDTIQNVIKILQGLYTKPLIAFFIFAVLFIIVRGRAALRLPSKATAIEVADNLLLIVVNSLLAAFVFGNLSFLSNLIFVDLALPHFTENVWHNVSKPVMFIFVLFALDFQNYCVHRLLHTKYFWGAHLLHHSDTQMTWSTYYRIHIFEWVLMSFTYVIILGWLSLPVEIVATAAVVRSWYSKFTHCHLRWTFGKFRKIIASPNYHRWHHSISPEAYGKNLCDMFPLWDILFGTHYDPGLCETKTGVVDAPEGFLSNQVYPFKYIYDAIKKDLPGHSPNRSQIP